MEIVGERKGRLLKDRLLSLGIEILSVISSFYCGAAETSCCFYGFSCFFPPIDQDDAHLVSTKN